MRTFLLAAAVTFVACGGDGEIENRGARRNAEAPHAVRAQEAPALPAVSSRELERELDALEREIAGDAGARR